MFLRSLYDEQLLQYNFGTMSWRWDDDEVEAKLATENVATVLVNKLRRLNSSTQNIVKVASCLGAKFSLSAVATITDSLSPGEMRKLSSIVGTESETDDDDGSDALPSVPALESSINELEDEGIWEKEPNDAESVYLGMIKSNLQPLN